MNPRFLDPPVLQPTTMPDKPPPVFERITLGMPTWVPKVDEVCEMEHRRDQWRQCVVTAMRQTKGCWEYRVKFVTDTGRLEERWWKGSLRPTATT